MSQESVSPVVSSQWYCAFLLQQWKNQVAPKVRKAYKTDDPSERLALLQDIEYWMPSKQGCARVRTELAAHLGEESQTPKGTGS